MKIHFVCTGNTFRSRLAEAYLNSKKIPGVMVSSSGVEAIKDQSGPINWYAQRIIEENGLVASEPMSWTQTTKEILENQEYIIFMQKWHYDQCVKRFGFTGDNFEIWDIEDIPAGIGGGDSAIISRSEKIYKNITKDVDDLISRKF